MHSGGMGGFAKRYGSSLGGSPHKARFARPGTITTFAYFTMQSLEITRNDFIIEILLVALKRAWLRADERQNEIVPFFD
jgi:hypothetical protein